MASNTEIGNPRDHQQFVVETFRQFYQSVPDDIDEATRVPLVSHHDPSIRFTNSTTSVMKPYLTGIEPLDRPVFLAQPAMGQQGLSYWQREHAFGPYASYFVSLGSLYPATQAEPALRDMVAIAESWSIAPEDISFHANDLDVDLLHLIDKSGLHVVSDGADMTDDYRHQYGLGDIDGRNANMKMVDASGGLRTLGNLTLIQCMNTPIAYEISFDSSTVTSLLRRMSHPVNAHDERISLGLDSERVARLDMLSTSAALLVEGLTPASKGRSGVLRKFLLEYMQLARDIDNATPEDISDELEAVARTEAMFRSVMSPERRASSSYKNAASVISEWVGPLYKTLAERS